MPADFVVADALITIELILARNFQREYDVLMETKITKVVILLQMNLYMSFPTFHQFFTGDPRVKWDSKKLTFNIRKQ